MCGAELSAVQVLLIAAVMTCGTFGMPMLAYAFDKENACVPVSRLIGVFNRCRSRQQLI